MKHLSKIWLLPLLFFVFTACIDKKQEQSVEVKTAEEVKEQKEEIPDIADSSFKDGMTGAVYHYYLKVRTALFNDDLDAAKDASESIANSFDEDFSKLKSLSEKMARAEDIEQLRSAFSEFSIEVESLFKQNLSAGTIYKQHCPMAFNNKGAFWFAEVEEIKNPYKGEKMPKCGSVTETIKPKK
ncbi:DUF3347 domain-containing protein [Salegentibacter sp. LM13S]|uniref:DUF3347 domain-containing protein n=1 Tax=Salegentibacter lacus TaxID=2873599 RepID=UPI001CC91F3F|nr:DUF3347 domain-containing protein [Salegentibacter lacus]MBZ9632475.1 DUF3347 domain-containing protein [Salegentibacter lacus]